MSICLTQLNTDEVLRYMGCPPEEADDALRAAVEAGARSLLRTARPRWTYRVFDLEFEPGGVRLVGGMFLPGEDLKGHLAGCSRVAVFCATLGAETDLLIRRAEPRDVLELLILDSCGTAAAEDLCDQAEQELHAMFPGCHFPFRYSPGYGDLPLSVQGELLHLLDAPRRVGLTATSSHILIPRKSVTAILGVSDAPVPSHIRSCLACPGYLSCQYRKSGGHCGIS